MRGSGTVFLRVQNRKKLQHIVDGEDEDERAESPPCCIDKGRACPA